MSVGEATKVLQVGSPVAGSELFYAAMARPDLPFELEAIATTNPDLRGKKLGRAYPNAPAELSDVPFIGMMAAIEQTDAQVVFSNLETKLISRYETRLAAGRLLVVGARPGQERPEAPVVSAFTNPGHIDELYGRDAEGKIIDTGNSLAALLAVPLAPLHKEIGIESLGISSLQGWSDAGMVRVPELVADTRSDVHPLDDQKHAKAQADIEQLLGSSIDTPADIRFDSMKLRHGPWVRGHYAKVVARLERETSKEELEHIWRHFEAPEAVEGFRPELKALSRLGKEKWPGRYQKITPVKLEHGDLLRYDAAKSSPTHISRIWPMRVGAHILAAGSEDPRTLTFEVAGDNLIQGLVGGGLADVLYARERGYLA